MGALSKRFNPFELIKQFKRVGQRLSGKEIDNATFVGRYCSCFCCSSIAGSWIPHRKSRQFT
jgi:hypothetical protein